MHKTLQPIPHGMKVKIEVTNTHTHTHTSANTTIARSGSIADSVQQTFFPFIGPALPWPSTPLCSVREGQHRKQYEEVHVYRLSTNRQKQNCLSGNDSDSGSGKQRCSIRERRMANGSLLLRPLQSFVCPEQGPSIVRVSWQESYVCRLRCGVLI